MALLGLGFFFPPSFGEEQITEEGEQTGVYEVQSTKPELSVLGSFSSKLVYFAANASFFVLGVFYDLEC